MKKQKIIIGILVLVLFLALGLGYAFLPYESKESLNITFSLSEKLSVAVGILISLVGVVAFLLIILTDTLKKFRKYGRRFWYFFLIFDLVKWIIIIAMGYFLIRGGIGVTQSVIG